MDHIAVTHTYCDAAHCVICHGGLFLCQTCGSAEGASTDDCPGVRLTLWASDEVYAGRLNFRAGAWHHERSAIWEYLGSRRGIPRVESSM